MSYAAFAGMGKIGQSVASSSFVKQEYESFPREFVGCALIPTPPDIFSVLQSRRGRKRNRDIFLISNGGLWICECL